MRYSDSPPIIKLLAFLCFPALAYVMLNTILTFFNIYGNRWIRESDLVLRNGLPFFLFLTGSFIRNKKLRIPLLLFFPVFFAGYVLKTLDYFELIDMHTKWIIGPFLLGLLLTYSVHFFSKKQKTVLDYLKMIWFLMISYVMLSFNLPKAFKVIWIYEASGYVMMLLMIYGLIVYFRKPEIENGSLHNENFSG